MKTPRFSAANYARVAPFLAAVDGRPDGLYVFTSAGQLPLTVENLAYTFRGCPVYSLTQYHIQSGETLRDPEFTFYVDGARLIPMSYRCDSSGSYQDAFPVPDQYCPATLRALDILANLFTKRLLAQGYDADQAQRVPQLPTE